MFIQQVTGIFLYYARVVDATMILALSAIVSDQAAPTKETTKKVLRLLDCVTTHPDTILSFSRSSMVLNIHIDVSYLCEPKAKIRTGGHFFLSDNASDPRNNGTVLNITHILKNVMSSAEEAAIRTLFLNSRHVIPARTTLIEMRHHQPPTPTQTDTTPALECFGKHLMHKAPTSTDI
jgi:hypothetical protein